MNVARLTEVLNRLETAGLSQMLVCDPLSIWYLTGYYTQPYERFFALYLARRDGQMHATLFCNQLFPDTGHCCADVVRFADTDDPVPLVAAVCDPHAPLGID